MITRQKLTLVNIDRVQRELKQRKILSVRLSGRKQHPTAVDDLSAPILDKTGSLISEWFKR